MAIVSIVNPPDQRPQTSTVSPGDLPWATVLMPTTSSGHSGIGINRHGLKTDTWVYGFFADGDSCQIPVIHGVWPAGPGGGVPMSTQIPENGGTQVASISLVGTDNTMKAFNFFVQRRFTPEQSAGIVGCLYKESNLNPRAKNSAGGGRGAFGIAQWRSTRLASLEKFALTANTSIEELQIQLEFIMEELLKTEAIANRLLQQAKNPMDAAIAFAHFERGEDYSGACYRVTGNGCPTNINVANEYRVNRNILLDRIKFANSIYKTATNNDTTVGITGV